MFAIECDSGIDIRKHSYFKTEDEMLLLPARHFQVHGSLDQGGGLHVIQLKEIQPPVPILEPVTVGKSKTSIYKLSRRIQFKRDIYF